MFLYPLDGRKVRLPRVQKPHLSLHLLQPQNMPSSHEAFSGVGGVDTTEMGLPGESLRRRQTVRLEWVWLPACLPATAVLSHPLAALPHGKCSRSLDQNPERNMCSSRCTHLLSLGAQLPNVRLNLLPEAEHSLELCQQEMALIVWDTHALCLAGLLTVPRDGLSPSLSSGTNGCPAPQHSLQAREWTSPAHKRH